MSADPPWFEEAVDVAEASYRITPNARFMIRAALAFAARQPREITEAMVNAAAINLQSIFPAAARHVIARRILEAAEKARLT